MAEDIERLRQAALKDPAQLVRLADALVANDRSEEAVQACRRGLSARPDDIPLRLALGRALSAAGQLEEAQAALLDAVVAPAEGQGGQRARPAGGAVRAAGAAGGDGAQPAQRRPRGERRSVDRRATAAGAAGAARPRSAAAVDAPDRGFDAAAAAHRGAAHTPARDEPRVVTGRPALGRTRGAEEYLPPREEYVPSRQRFGAARVQPDARPACGREPGARRRRSGSGGRDAVRHWQ